MTECINCHSLNVYWDIYEKDNDILRCRNCGMIVSEDELRRGELY